jgi:hypothetical protein
MTISVNFRLYMLNLLNAFTQQFVMVKEYRHKNWMESYRLHSIGAD